MTRLSPILRHTLSWFALSLMLVTGVAACGAIDEAHEPTGQTAETFLGHLNAAERTAEAFLGHLKAHEFGLAHRQLMDSAISRISAHQLQNHIEMLESRYGAISKWTQMGNSLSVRSGSATRADFCYSSHHARQLGGIVTLELRPANTVVWLISDVQFIVSDSLRHARTGLCFQISRAGGVNSDSEPFLADGERSIRTGLANAQWSMTWPAMSRPPTCVAPARTARLQSRKMENAAGGSQCVGS